MATHSSHGAYPLIIIQAVPLPILNFNHNHKRLAARGSGIPYSLNISIGKFFEVEQDCCKSDLQTEVGNSDSALLSALGAA